MRLLALVLVTAVASVAAQDSVIEVVSIKPTPPGTAGGSFGNRPGGGIVTVNMPMSSLISLAYQLPNSTNIEGAPDWFQRQGFDVNAKYTGRLTPEQTRAAWQAVFADRFKLKARIETREVAAFNVVLDRPERGVPQGLTKIDVDCAARNDAFRRGETPPDLKLLPSGITPCGASYRGSTITSGGMPISQFVWSIQNGLGRILIDKTGLEGNYAFTISSAPSRPGAPNPDNLPDMVTALKEQLGLKLEPTRTTTEYLVIEHIERPTPD